MDTLAEGIHVDRAGPAAPRAGGHFGVTDTRGVSVPTLAGRCPSCVPGRGGQQLWELHG